MKVFISWSGERSRLMAQDVRDWMDFIFHDVEPWLSEVDIAAGDRWAPAIATELELTNFGVLCLTPENLSSPWILFEAGALAKSVGTGKVIPLLLAAEFRTIGPPLSQFQAKGASREGLGDIAGAINRATDQPIAPVRLVDLLDAAWPRLEEVLLAIPPAAEAPPPPRSPTEVLEDLISEVRGLGSRLSRDLEASREPKGQGPAYSNRLRADELLQAADSSRRGIEPSSRRILELLARGASTRQIAAEMGMSVRTVERLIRSILSSTHNMTDQQLLLRRLIVWEGLVTASLPSDQSMQQTDFDDEEETENA